MVGRGELEMRINRDWTVEIISSDPA